MGSAQVQGEIFGVKAHEWAEIQEPTWRPVYLQILKQARIDAGKSLLDVPLGDGDALTWKKKNAPSCDSRCVAGRSERT